MDSPLLHGSRIQVSAQAHGAQVPFRKWSVDSMRRYVAKVSLNLRRARSAMVPANDVQLGRSEIVQAPADLPSPTQPPWQQISASFCIMNAGKQQHFHDTPQILRHPRLCSQASHEDCTIFLERTGVRPTHQVYSRVNAHRDGLVGRSGLDP